MKINFITNIISPYRIDLFNSLDAFIKTKNIESGTELCVHFMSISEPNRNWIINFKQILFDYKVHSSFKLSFRNYFFYFTPYIIFQAIVKKNEIFILGASWNNFNILLIVFFKRIGIVKARLHLWSEANKYYASKSKKSKLLFRLKKYVFNSIDGCYLVPGNIAIQTILEYSLNNDRFIYFPNLVSDKFLSNCDYNQIKNKNNVILIVARLDEKIKGILNFFKSIELETLKTLNFKIIGSGPSQKLYNEFIVENALINNISIVNDLPYDEMINEYKSASMLILPSFYDSSPLVLVEAIFSGLPLLCSNRCGNICEVLEIGENGYSFDPYDSSDISFKFNLMISQRDKWPSMSIASKKIVEKNFNQTKIFSDFLTIINTH